MLGSRAMERGGGNGRWSKLPDEEIALHRGEWVKGEAHIEMEQPHYDLHSRAEYLIGLFSAPRIHPWSFRDKVIVKARVIVRLG